MRISTTAILALSTFTACAAFTPVSQPARQPFALNMANPDKSVFLSSETAKACIDIAGGSPVYAYSIDKLDKFANDCLAFPNAYGLTVRYAMKACPNSAILKFFSTKGIHIDASSGYEAHRAMSAGIPAENISLSTQELPSDFADLIKMGVKVNAW